MPDQILYSVVARQTVVLAEFRCTVREVFPRLSICFTHALRVYRSLISSFTLHSAYAYAICSVVQGNANLVAHRILDKLPSEDR
jgi:hypothetical protein